ncbi:MAG: hypothetical protein WCI76_01755 [bacterium]
MQKGVDYIAVGVSYFCHDGKGNYLMNKRSKNCRDEHGTWDLGGGGLEIGWFRLDKLPAPLHSQIQKQIDLYKDKLK